MHIRYFMFFYLASILFETIKNLSSTVYIFLNYSNFIIYFSKINQTYFIVININKPEKIT